MSGSNDDWKRGARPLDGAGLTKGVAARPSASKMSEIRENYATFVVEHHEDQTFFVRRADVSHRMRKELGSGSVRIDAQLDLHGCSRQEAATNVIAFVRQARSRGYRTLLLIHGKGLHAEDGVGVLGHVVVDVLTRGPTAPWLLAVSTAHPRWGGTGALVVKLARER
ncbi:MAG: Smr/MutS family protein [Myxococcales bacterium]|nr:Smr/MutS family protein [Myxococcales bacterium]